MQTDQPGLSPGDRMPLCAGMGPDRQPYSFDVQAGRPALLLLAGDASVQSLSPVIAALMRHAAAVSAMQCDLRLLLGPNAGLQALQSLKGADCGMPMVICQDGLLAGGEAALLVAIDRAARVVASWRPAAHDPSAVADAAVATLADLGRQQARDCLSPAPVLAIPRLLEKDLCAELIESFERSANFDSGISGVGPDGQPHHRLDANRKRRRDWLLEAGDGFYARVLGALSHRCVPELRRAFQHEISHVDRVLVARYDESGGYFRRHRDNVGRNVAFRQFALSVNLNTDAYDGGYLMFPEYNDHRYRPATGDGIVFSASLLHEATPVTRGQRYVLLTFLHDAAGEERRLAAAGGDPAA